MELHTRGLDLSVATVDPSNSGHRVSDAELSKDADLIFSTDSVPISALHRHEQCSQNRRM
jgi:hypothetical protein